MKYNKWSNEIWEKLEKALEMELRTNPTPIAAFDADGTLWDTDLGETFFRYQIKNSGLAGLPADPWKHYRDWKGSGDPRPAYLWLAQINKGQPFSQVQSWAEAAVAELKPLPVFEEQQRWIELLQKSGAEVYIVTASVKWAVEPGAQRLGLRADQVLGIRTEIKDGIVSDQQEGVITYREGKVDALLAQTGGRKPFFASGNTMGDYSLCQAATGVAMAVGAAGQADELWKTEEELRTNANQHGWLIHKF